MKIPYINTAKGRTGGTYYYYRRGKFSYRLKVSPGSGREWRAEYDKAERAYDDFAKTGQNFPRHCIIDGLCEGYLAGPDFRALQPSSQYGYRRVVEEIRERAGHLLVATFGPAQLRRLLTEKAATPSARQNMLKKMRCVWKAGIASGAIDERQAAPWANLPRLKRPKERRTVWTDDLAAQFARRWPAGTREHLLMTLGYETLQRASDLVRMGPRLIEGDIIILRQQKGDNRVTLPISNALGAALAATATGRDVFVTKPNGKRYSSPKTLADFFSKACKAAGIEGMSCHSLRRGGATRLVNLGASLPEVASLGGWKSLTELSKYIQSSDGGILSRRAVDRINAAAAVQPIVMPPQNGLQNGLQNTTIRETATAPKDVDLAALSELFRATSGDPGWTVVFEHFQRLAGKFCNPFQDQLPNKNPRLAARALAGGSSATKGTRQLISGGPETDRNLVALKSRRKSAAGQR